MPLGSKGANVPPATTTGEKPVVFQKYFKNGHRTYASQVKLSQNGKKYLVLTEGHRDPETDEVKKHTLIVFEQDLKQFFSMMQETVVYLRANRDPGSTVTGMTPPSAEPAQPATPPAAAAPRNGNGAAKPAKPPISTKAPANGNAAKSVVIQKPAVQTKPVPSAKVQPRPAATRTAAPAKPIAKAPYRPGTRSNGR